MLVANGKKLGILTSGPNNILTHALKIFEHSDRIKAKGIVKHNAYFNIPKSSEVVEIDERKMLL